VLVVAKSKIDPSLYFDELELSMALAEKGLVIHHQLILVGKEIEHNVWL